MNPFTLQNHHRAFFYQRLLPRTLTYAEAMKTGVEVLHALDAEHFSFD